MTPGPTPKTQRYHGLDALRGGAMLLGLVFHAGLVFIDPSIVADVSGDGAEVSAPAPATWALVVWIHTWRMPLFFVLAGFFAARTIELSGPARFLRDRALRVLGTLLLFLTVFAIALGRPWGQLDHLWFLWFLALYAALGFAFEPIRRPARPARTGGRALLALGAATSVAASVAVRSDGIWHRVPERIDDIEIAGFLYYFVFYVLGSALWHRRAVLADLSRPAVAEGLLSLGSLAALWVAFTLPAERGGVAGAAVSGVATAAMVFGLIGVAGRIVRRSAPVDAVARLAYPVYVLHLYPTVVAASYLAAAGFGQGATIALGALAGLLASVACYWLFIRHTPLDWFFAGPGRARFRWPFARTENGRPAGGDR